MVKHGYLCVLLLLLCAITAHAGIVEEKPAVNCKELIRAHDNDGAMIKTINALVANGTEFSKE